MSTKETKRILSLIILLLVFSSCSPKTELIQSTDNLIIKKVGFKSLEGWEKANIFSAKRSVIQSCKKIKEYKEGKILQIAGEIVQITNYKKFCQAIISSKNNENFKYTIEKYFYPVLLRSKKEKHVHYTGYVELEVEGSLEKNNNNYVPIYSKPDLLVQIDPNDFSSNLRGKETVGLLKNGKIIPAPTRKQIERGNLFKEHIIAYLNDPARAYFLHIQGSGRLKLPDGSFKFISYSGDNGKKYKSIGKILIEKGYIDRKNLSMQSIERWMHNNPQESIKIMNMNERYIFFKFRKEKNPVGSSGVELTMFHSAAVDNRFIPYHTLLWPGIDLRKAEPMENRTLFIAQDRGAAIKGPMRVDLFLGYGKEAEIIAGSLSKKEKLWALIPRNQVPITK